MTPPLLQSSLRVVSAGAALFADTVAGQGVPVEQVDWRPPAEGSPQLAALLGRLIAAQRAGRGEGRIPIGYLARLNRAFDTATAKSESDPRRGSAPTAPGIVEPLTNRELEVLQMLAAGQSNQAIAGQLVVTLDTVKKHVTHLLGKLGAANRTEAVARARELGLIS